MNPDHDPEVINNPGGLNAPKLILLTLQFRNYDQHSDPEKQKSQFNLVKLYNLRVARTASYSKSSYKKLFSK